MDTAPVQTPASVDVVDGSQIRARQPGINLSEGLAAVPGLQIQNRQNYARICRFPSVASGPAPVLACAGSGGTWTATRPRCPTDRGHHRTPTWLRQTPS